MIAPPALKLAWQGFLDVLYPPLCLICGGGDAPPICDRCHQTFLSIPNPVCAVCGRPREGERCLLCEERKPDGWGFDAARAASVYQGPLREAIHRLKFQQIELLGPPLGEYLASCITADDLLDGCLPRPADLVVPVPLHPKKLRKRGFNQSSLIAAPLASGLGIPLAASALTRTLAGRTQVGLSAKERRGNLSPDAFAVSRALSVQGKTILLVDDVFTTGTTLSACALVLKDAGAACVVAVALAAGG